MRSLAKLLRYPILESEAWPLGHRRFGPNTIARLDEFILFMAEWSTTYKSWKQMMRVIKKEFKANYCNLTYILSLVNSTNQCMNIRIKVPYIWIVLHTVYFCILFSLWCECDCKKKQKLDHCEINWVYGSICHWENVSLTDHILVTS